MQKQESARSSTFHKLKSLEPCWVSTHPICFIMFYQFFYPFYDTNLKAMLLSSPAPNLPIHFPRPLKPSDSTLSPWPHGWLYMIMLVNRESTSRLGHTGVFPQTQKPPKKTREPIHSHLNPWQYWRLHGSWFFMTPCWKSIREMELIIKFFYLRLFQHFNHCFLLKC